jgi:hypothetical protein
MDSAAITQTKKKLKGSKGLTDYTMESKQTYNCKSTSLSEEDLVQQNPRQAVLKNNY